MRTDHRSVKRIVLGAAVLGVAILAACGGGGNSTSVAPGPAQPVPGASGLTTFSASDAVAIPSAAPGSASVLVQLPSDPSGASANTTLSASANIPTDTTIDVTYASSGDPSLPALSVSRQVLSRAPLDDAKRTGIAYLRLRFSADISFAQAPSFTFTVPGTLTTNGVSYWLALYDPLRAAAGWQENFEGPATVTPTTVHGKVATQLAFASNGQPFTLSAYQTYWLAVVAVPAGSASPTPVPSSIPTNPPPEHKPAPTLASPTRIVFPSVSATPVALTFSQTGNTDGFTLHGDCTGVVNTSGASPTWTIAPVGAGRCAIVGLGDRGAAAVVHVVVYGQLPSPEPSPSFTPVSSPSPIAGGSPSPSPSASASASASPTPSASVSPTASATP